MPRFAPRLALLAAALLTSAAAADEGAYLSLLGMSRSAAVDRGPDAGPAAPASPEPRADSAAPVLAPIPLAAGAQTPVSAAAPDLEVFAGLGMLVPTGPEDFTPPPAAPRPKRHKRLDWVLAPARRPVRALAVAVSTAAAVLPADAPRVVAAGLGVLPLAPADERSSP